MDPFHNREHRRCSKGDENSKIRNIMENPTKEECKGIEPWSLTKIIKI